MSGRLGVHTEEGIFTLDDTDVDNPCVSLNMFESFGMGVPAFAQNTPVDQVKVGDLLVGTKEVLGWVLKIEDSKFTLIKPNGNVQRWQPPKVQMFGFDSGVMVVRSLMTLLPGGKGGLDQMQNMLQMMMFTGGDLDFEQIMPMMLMSQMGGSADGAANPMASMMPMMMMMMNMMKGDKKPMSSMFSGNKGSFFDRSN